MKLMENSLRELGFNQYESRVYYSLLQEGPLTASAVSSKAKIPRPRVYDVLDSLSSRGIVIVHPGRPGKFQAVDTNTLIDILKKEENERFQKRISKYDKVKRTLVETVPEKKDGNGESVWVLKGEHAVHNKIREIIKESKEEIVIIGDPLVKKMRAHENTLNTAVKQGAKVKVVALNSGGIELAEQVKRDAAHMLLADDQALIFLNQNPEDQAVWIKSRHLVNGLKKMLRE